MSRGDLFLICSDGLSDLVSDEELDDALNCADTVEKVDKLVDLAKSKGGADNITLVVIEVAEVAGKTKNSDDVSTVG